MIELFLLPCRKSTPATASRNVTQHNGQNNFNDFNGNQNIELNVDNNNQQSIDEQDYNNNAMQNDLLQSDQPQGQKQKGKITDFIRKSSNPSVALMTVGLKIASLFFFSISKYFYKQ